MKRLQLLLITLVCGLSACGSPTPSPNYTVRVQPTADGKSYVATPPTCPTFANNDDNFFDNQPLPQFGCATSRNVAMMVERPTDLIEGRPSGPANGVTTAGSIVRYNNNQTRGLIWLAPTPDTSADATTAPTAASAMTGETPAASPSASPLGK